MDTVFRIFEHYVQTLSPKFVCVLMPPPMRFEFNDSDNGYPVIQACNLGNHPSFAKDWLSQDCNGELSRKKTIMAMAKICDWFKIPLVVSDSQHLNGVFSDLARDLAHHGINYQKRHAKYMHDQLQQLGVC
jgi:hypothetical protein